MSGLFTGLVPCVECDCEGVIGAGYEDAYTCPWCGGLALVESDASEPQPEGPEPELIPADAYAEWLETALLADAQRHLGMRARSTAFGTSEGAGR